MVHTGIYSEETGRPQPLRFTIRVKLKVQDRVRARHPARCEQELHGPEVRLRPRRWATRHYKLIEAVADHVCETLFVQDSPGRGGQREDRQAGAERGGRADRHHPDARAALMAMQRISRSRGLPEARSMRPGGFPRRIPARGATALIAGSDIGAGLSPQPIIPMGWRRAAIQELAREAAPCRVNAVQATTDGRWRGAGDYLERAPGMTGQLLRRGWQLPMQG